MKNIFRIARIELNTLFFSPVVWVLFVVLFLLTGIEWLDQYQEYLRVSARYPTTEFYYRLMTERIMSRPFEFLYSNAFWFMPLLTMGLVSREVSSGTIRLLYSSPVDVKDILLGKFIAMLVIIGALLLLFLPIYSFELYTIQRIDIPFLLCKIGALYLTICTFAAIGLFLSCLTGYQVVAAIGTLTVLSMLRFVTEWGQDTTWIRRLTHAMSIDTSYRFLDKGLINSRSVGLLLVIAILFLCFGYIRLRSGRKNKGKLITLLLYGGALAGAVAAGYLFAVPKWVMYKDVTREEVETITPHTQQLLRSMDKGVLEINHYINILDRSMVVEELGGRQGVVDYWESYQRFKRDIKFTYTYYYDSVFTDPDLMKRNSGMSLDDIARQYIHAHRMSMKDVLTPKEIRARVNLLPEWNRYAVELKYAGRTTFLRMYDDWQKYPLEQQTATALKMLLTEERPRVMFLTGHYERDLHKRDARHYSGLADITNRYSYLNNGFVIDTLNLSTDTIPSDIVCLVIADPRVTPGKEETAILQRYIASGGNLLLAMEPDREGYYWPLASMLGVRMRPGLMIHRSTDDAPDLLKSVISLEAGTLDPTLNSLARDSGAVVMSGATSLIFDSAFSFHCTPVVRNRSRVSWQVSVAPRLDTGDIVFHASNGDDRGPNVQALALTRQANRRQQRILVTGDADWLSANLGGWNERSVNGALGLQLFSWFSGGAFPVDVSRTLPSGYRVVHLRMKDMVLLRWLFLGVIPALLALSGLTLLVRRKRY